MAAMDIPSVAWRRRLDATLSRPGAPASWPLRVIFRLLPTYLRLRAVMREDRRRSRESVLVAFDTRDTGPVQGVPLGGIGGGTLTRGWRGDFTRFQVQPPGCYRYGAVPADQFSVSVARDGEPAAATVLNPCAPKSKALRAWRWALDGSRATYHALYPRAWTEYDDPLPGVRMVCRQVSPIIPGDYVESCLPCAVFCWSIENTGVSPATVGLLFTFKRLVEAASFDIACSPGPGITISSARFDADGDGSDLWSGFQAHGRLDGQLGEGSGSAVCATLRVAPGEKREVAFSIAWDAPLARFGGGRAWYRRYTRYYGKDGLAASALARHALEQFPDWEERIDAWQKPVLADPTLPDWYKSALFNELYYVADGGTIWTDGEEGKPSLPEDDVGHFAYLEGHEYRMYNTYDVHFYASFALAMLWPRLELSVQRDFARVLAMEDPECQPLLSTSKRVPRKIAGAVPHDLGAPGEDPFVKVNAYSLRDTSRWKDLNPKFVLQIWRDFALTRDAGFLEEVMPAVRQALSHMDQFDTDGDGLIENEGIPDQTYDTWSVRGPSAYSGGLWLASLAAAAALEDAAGKPAAAKAFRQTLARGSAAYESRLWNGTYYDYDASTGKSHDSVMADQLAGHWYARACGLPPVVPQEHARSALRAVYAQNVAAYRNGEAGAVNGTRPGGEVDISDEQSQEVWAGTTYAVAAAMLQEGLREEAFRTARGVYRVAWEERGYWFQTPEAWKGAGDYRSLAYMRPLAIWAMQWALDAAIRKRITPPAPPAGPPSSSSRIP
jgi:non-lysosomal glucosylceramidase